ncbi:hypothetical protein BJ165DRAFT_1526345 [Panaeolus papilionaceus]|nr:hypothetical protein BJ165DRAFT_1526345 [Panaeolus papilionaceus]
MPIETTFTPLNGVTPDGSDPATTTSEGVPLAHPIPVSFGVSTNRVPTSNATNVTCPARGCNATFPDEGQLLDHKASKLDVGHYFCILCSSAFEKQTNLNKHQLEESHIQRSKICPFCDKAFPTPAHTAFHHLLEKAHFTSGKMCPFCSKKFELPDRTLDHVTKGECRAAVEDGVWGTTREQLKACKIYCSQCPAGFADDAMLYQHYATALPSHFWCFVCSMHHKSAGGLALHLRSFQHTLNHKSCPFCHTTFVSPSMTAQHLTNKHQCSAFRNGTVNEYVMGVATAQVLPPSLSFVPASMSSTSSPATLSNAITSSSQSAQSQDSTNSTSTVKYTATEASFNGQAYICFICQNGFNTLSGLNSHLQSSIHKDTGEKFSCPKCSKQFRELSGMVQHIESGSCGFTMPKQVIDHVRELTAQYAQHHLTL